MEYSFDKYIEDNINSSTTYQNYKGIIKKEHPKWVGWKLINKYKKENIKVYDIFDDDLNLMVRNFYYIQFISTEFK